MENEIKTKQFYYFSTRVKPEWFKKLKEISYKQDLKYAAVLENSLNCYWKELNKKISNGN